MLTETICRIERAQGGLRPEVKDRVFKGNEKRKKDEKTEQNRKKLQKNEKKIDEAYMGAFHCLRNRENTRRAEAGGQRSSKEKKKERKKQRNEKAQKNEKKNS